MRKIPFMKKYVGLARQLATLRIGKQWADLAERLPAGLPALTPAEAAAWAGLGFYPSEAENMIRSELTAATYAEMERHAEDRAGGPDALAVIRIAELIAGGLEVDGGAQ